MIPLALALGCGGGISPMPSADAGPVHFSSLEDPAKFKWKTTCAISVTCHGSASGRLGNIDLETDPYRALVGQATVETMYPTAEAMYPSLVIPGNSAQSFLMVKLELPRSDTPDPNLGTYMPQSAAHFDAALLASFKAWIDDGALQ